MMEAILSSETSVFTRATWRYISEDGTLRFITCSLYQENQNEEDGMGGACNMTGWGEKYTRSFGRKSRRNERWEEVCDRIIIKWLLQEWDYMVYNGFKWLMTGTSTVSYKYGSESLCFVRFCVLLMTVVHN
jgi:hypothetical protein